MSSTDELKNSRMEEMAKLAELHLPLSRWNFRKVTSFFYNIHPQIIYESDKCRIKLMYQAPDPWYTDPDIFICYGRLEVPNDASIASRSHREKNYHLWHSVYILLDFLSGLSPREAKLAQHPPRWIREFQQSDIVRGIGYEPERDVIMHATIWETYGNQLFDIFDSRNTELWESYSKYVKEFWETLAQP